LTGLQDFQVTPPEGVHMGTITGGLRPSAIPDRAFIGAGMRDSATADLSGTGNPLTGLTAMKGLTLPTVPPLPSPNAAQTAMGIAAPALSLAPTFMDLLNKFRSQRTAAGSV
jgi:hypothetical protein